MLIERLITHTRLTNGQIERYAATASKQYKVYRIPKRTGGFRTIEQPSKAIKALQRWLIRVLFMRFPVHECATAYKRGLGIRSNAVRHVESNFTLRTDFVEFFPSFNIDQVILFIKHSNDAFSIGLTSEDILFAARIVCRNNALTIGAPSSPILTNAMMFEFDVALHQLCERRNLIYTRYADDIFISSILPGDLTDIPNEIGLIAATHRYATLSMNDEKLAFLSRRYKRSITGLVLTPDRHLSIGLDRKNNIKSSVYKYAKGDLAPDEIGRARGMLAFIMDVEPSFYHTLTRKYGSQVVENLRNGVDPVVEARPL